MTRVEVFSTCPQSRDLPREAYAGRVIDAARWSEEAGCHGMLVYTDNGIADPWLVSQLIIQHTKHLTPLVAVQPAYMSPFSVAKMVASLGWMHGRRVALNMVAGGFRNDLLALGDPTPHDERYERLVEYVAIITALLSDSAPVTFEGKHYRVRGLKMMPALPDGLMPDILVSGSSAAGEAAAVAMGAIGVTYPEPTTDAPAAPAAADGRRRGVRVGIIAREDAEAAWTVAYERFPDTRAGRITHGLAMKVSDSQWHRQLSALDARPADNHPYWLGPFQTSATFCPYLVGTYARVAEELARYAERGASLFILDIPPSREDLHHTALALRLAFPSSHVHSTG